MTTTADGIQLTQSQIAGQDSFQISIQFNPFRILESSNGTNLVEINNQDTLFYESGATEVD